MPRFTIFTAGGIGHETYTSLRTVEAIDIVAAMASVELSQRRTITAIVNSEAPPTITLLELAAANKFGPKVVVPT